MQQPTRMVLSKASTITAAVRRSIHSTSSSSNPAVVLAGESRRAQTESHDASNALKFRPLGPRAKAEFGTAIPRAELGFLPLEASIIFPRVALKVKMPEIMVPFIPTNFTIRPAAPEPIISKPIVTTVSEEISHISAPAAIVQGGQPLVFDFAFARQPMTKKDDSESMMRAFRV